MYSSMTKQPWMNKQKIPITAFGKTESVSNTDDSRNMLIN